ncbi:hypothetical protein [Arenimonas daejeonensis]|uniref:hypothetical protein n=1 Tax=Arenimonas daejeonensis TaxID=370777 RepID=UPI0011BE8A27|nr:hypothetical protein [Arenimonas daejeonensis]
MSLLTELGRRNVIRMAGLYLVGAWLVVQVAETVLPAFDVPGWVLRALIILLAIGFVPALVVSWVFELTPEGLKRDRGPVPDKPMAARTGRRMDRLLLVGLGLVTVLILADRFWPSTPEISALAGSEAGSGPLSPAADDPSSAETAGEGEPASESPAPAARKSIAVLAFADLSPEQDQEYFSDGMAEEILNALAQVPGLKVTGRTSSFHFKGRDEDLRTIGEVLGVEHILEGSVRKQGNQVRITAQLVQASDGFHVWSQVYDGELSDVFELQERIAHAIADKLKLVLQDGPSQRLVTASTSSPEAYEKYLQATAIINRRQAPRFHKRWCNCRKRWRWTRSSHGPARAWPCCIS